MSLQSRLRPVQWEAGLDEAGRGCLAGPVVASAVILPPDYRNKSINDSKKLSAALREKLREEILRESLTWSIGIVSVEEIDRINILQASFKAMRQAVEGLSLTPEHLIIDGNRFTSHSIPNTCVVKGDGKFLSIAAASILAKTFRDDLMQLLHQDFPIYQWDRNKGYATELHREAILKHGICHWHRKSFTCLQPTLFNKG